MEGVMERSGGHIKRLFSKALRYTINRSDMSQRALAAACGISPSSMNDYLSARREGSEDLRRRLSAELGVPYDKMLARGQLLDKGYDPEEWEMIHMQEPPPGHEVKADARVFKRSEGKTRSDILLLPPVWKQEERADKIKDAFIGEFTLYKDFAYVKTYPTGGPTRWPDIAADNVMTIRRDWLDAHGGSENIAGFVALDDISEPTIRSGDMLLARTDIKGQVLAGKYYALHLPDDPTIYFRKLMRSGNSIKVMELGESFPVDELVIIGEVFWVGHEL
jgi:transcriptional regulator with XRE-family HTH domain